MKFHVIRSALLAGAAIAMIGQAPVRAADIKSAVWMTDQCKAGTAQNKSLGAGMLGIVLGPLIEAGIKGIGDALVKAGGPKDTHAVGTYDTDLYSVTVDVSGAEGAKPPITPIKQPRVVLSQHCLSAAFGPAATGADAMKLPAALEALKTSGAPITKDGTLDASVTGQLATALDASRTSLIVLEIREAPDHTAFRLVPRYVKMGKGFDGTEKERSLNFTVSLLAPGALADGDAAAVRTFTFPKVTLAKEEGVPVEAMASTWIPTPGVPDEVKTRIASASERVSDFNALFDAGEDEDDAAAKKKAQDKAVKQQAALFGWLQEDKSALERIAPYSFRVDLHEIRPGSQFLVKLGTFLGGQAEKLAPEIADRIDPAKRAEAKETGLDAIDALRLTAIEQAAALAKAQTEDDKPGADSARIKLAAACRKLEAEKFVELTCASLP